MRQGWIPRKVPLVGFRFQEERRVKGKKKLEVRWMEICLCVVVLPATQKSDSQEAGYQNT